MPLEKSSSEAAFRRNVAEMINADHPRDQALAAAYRIKRERRAAGGPVTPWFVRSEARSMLHQGPIMSAVPGRTDRHNMKVAPGSYVVPAQAVSHLGENNTMAGMAVLNKMFGMGPYGSAPMKIARGPGAPKLTGHVPRPARIASGGDVGDGDDGVDIVTAGGEYVIPPEVVAEIGQGDIDAGHAILDRWVTSIQKKHAETIKTLPKPAKR